VQGKAGKARSPMVERRMLRTTSIWYDEAERSLHTLYREYHHVPQATLDISVRRRGKNYDASMWRRRRRRRKKWRKSTNFQQNLVWFTYSN